jgi:hypothetical protein
VTQRTLLRIISLVAVLAAPVPAAADSGVSPEFKAAASAQYALLRAQERIRLCKRMPEGLEEQIHEASAKGHKVRVSKEDADLAQLLFSYRLSLAAWQGFQRGYGRDENHDCSPAGVAAQRFARCRAAIEDALNGGPVSGSEICSVPLF